MGYLIKGMPHDLLIKALTRVHGGHRYLPQVVTEALSSRIPGIARSPRSCSSKEATVKSHVSVILMRMNVTDRTQGVVEALKRGLVHL